MDKLTEIKDIGAETADDFRKSGYNSFEEIARATINELSPLVRGGEGSTRGIISQAKARVDKQAYIDSRGVVTEFKTGISILDQHFDGAPTGHFGCLTTSEAVSLEEFGCAIATRVLEGAFRCTDEPTAVIIDMAEIGETTLQKHIAESCSSGDIHLDVYTPDSIEGQLCAMNKAARQNRSIELLLDTSFPKYLKEKYNTNNRSELAERQQTISRYTGYVEDACNHFNSVGLLSDYYSIRT